MFPYITAFMPPEHLKLYESNILSGGLAARCIGPLTKTAFAPVKYRRYCTKCAADDIGRYGIMYWRRSHLIPGVSTCVEHSINLSETSLPLSFIPSFDITTCSFNGSMHPAKAAHTENVGVHLNFERSLQQEALRALNGNVRTSINWTAAYADRLHELGYTMPNQSLASLKLNHDLFYTAGSALLSEMQCSFNPDRRNAWPSLMPRPSSRQASPLKHIVFRAFCSNPTETEQEVYSQLGRPSKDYAAEDIALSEKILKYFGNAPFGTSPRTVKMLTELGSWSLYRHDRSKFPITKSVLARLKNNMSDVL